MSCNASDNHLPRRRFVAAAAVFLMAAGSADRGWARGGGDINRERAEKARKRAERQRKAEAEAGVISQRDFLEMSRSALFEHSQQPDPRIRGFSTGMSSQLFKMGIANLARTRALVRQMQETPRLRKRQALLRNEVEFARAKADGFWGLSVQKKKLVAYYEGVVAWEKNPREGLA